MNETWLTTHGDVVRIFVRRRVAGPLRGRRWYWNITAANGEIVANGEGYVRRIDAVSAAERHHPRVEVES